MSDPTYQDLIDEYGYHLLLHHTPARKPWYTTRNTQDGEPRFVVLHTAENVPDFDPPDQGAENVAAYGASTSRASWHATSDSDSIIPMLPDEYTAWHARGYNSGGLGLEIATQASRWTHDLANNPAWVDRTLDNAAIVVAGWCDRWDIPARLVPRSSVDRGVYGITYHMFLDPGRRSDPGDKFPLEILLQKVESLMAQFTPNEAARLKAFLKGIDDANADFPDNDQTTELGIGRSVTKTIRQHSRKPGTGYDHASTLSVVAHTHDATVTIKET